MSYRVEAYHIHSSIFHSLSYTLSQYIDKSQRSQIVNILKGDYKKGDYLHGYTPPYNCLIKRNELIILHKYHNHVLQTTR